MPNGKVRFAAVYGNGAAMGMEPRAVRRMSVWQFLAVVDGYAKANTPPDNGLSKAEEDELADWLGI